MSNIIPLPYYTPIFYNVILILCIIIFLKLLLKIDIINSSFPSFILFTTLTIYMGLRPVSGTYFGDMSTYNQLFESYANGMNINNPKDYVWHLFMKSTSYIMTSKTFFLLCAFLYITPLYIASKKWTGNYMYILFLMLIGSFSFWAAGTNGIRSAIATSIIILALSRNNKILKYSLLTLAISFHASMIIPISAYILTIFVKNSKYYFIGWLSAIPLSLILGSFWENFFSSLGFGDERISYLKDDQFADAFSSTGFRWDFLLYSSLPVFFGYYFIIIKKYNDRTYIQLFNIYVTANAFWILVIRASFSNRFAFLSWFLMAPIIFYPLLNKRFMKNQSVLLSFTILFYFSFTYFMNIIL